MTLDPRFLARLQDYRSGLGLFAKDCLRIRTKEGAIVPLILNRAQLHVDAVLDAQLRRIGRVRQLILKGRQMGMSSYIAARFYRKASLFKGQNVYILSHEQTASDALFGMVDRFQRYNPLAPETGTANIRELEFRGLESTYYVGTAGSKAGGRGKSTNMMHASEAAFWANAADHFASSVQTVADVPGSEIIIETTANGPSGEFYERWQDAIAGKGDYEALFIPWFWAGDYVREVPDGFSLSAERDGAVYSEVEYAELFGLSNAQMMWRRNKIFEFRSALTFDQEYPPNGEMAFVNKNTGAYHDAVSILKARKRHADPAGPLIMGVDPAGEGGDRFAVAYRRGHAIYKLEWRDKLTHGEGVAWLRSLIEEHDPAVVFIDAGGIGRPIISDLRSFGPRYGYDRIKAVNFGAPSQAKMAKPRAPGPKNRRAEMQMRLKEWLASEEGASLPDMDALQGDLLETKIKKDANNDLQLESKQDIRARGARSPDLADACGLTFAEFLYIENYTELKKTPSFGDPAVRPQLPEGDAPLAGSNAWMG